MRNIKATVKWQNIFTCLVSFCYDKEYCDDDKNPQLTYTFNSIKNLPLN